MNLLQLAVTTRCNMRCSYCAAAEHVNNDLFARDISWEHLEKWMDAYISPNEWHVEVTGGEPSLYPHIDELADYLEKRGFIYLVKSNGAKRTKNQISAWHETPEPPKHWDALLIIKDTEGWREKAERCGLQGWAFELNNLLGNEKSRPRALHKAYTFVTPEGTIKPCGHFVVRKAYIADMAPPFADWNECEGTTKFCPDCRASTDFAKFIKYCYPNLSEKEIWNSNPHLL